MFYIVYHVVFIEGIHVRLYGRRLVLTGKCLDHDW